MHDVVQQRRTNVHVPVECSDIGIPVLVESSTPIRGWQLSRSVPGWITSVEYNYNIMYSLRSASSTHLTALGALSLPKVVVDAAHVQQRDPGRTQVEWSDIGIPVSVQSSTSIRGWQLSRSVS